MAPIKNTPKPFPTFSTSASALGNPQGVSNKNKPSQLPSPVPTGQLRLQSPNPNTNSNSKPGVTLKPNVTENSFTIGPAFDNGRVSGGGSVGFMQDGPQLRPVGSANVSIKAPSTTLGVSATVVGIPESNQLNKSGLNVPSYTGAVNYGIEQKLSPHLTFTLGGSTGLNKLSPNSWGASFNLKW